MGFMLRDEHVGAGRQVHKGSTDCWPFGARDRSP